MSSMMRPGECPKPIMRCHLGDELAMLSVTFEGEKGRVFLCVFFACVRFSVVSLSSALATDMLYK